MKYLSLTFSALPVQAMAIYPFILFKEEKLKENRVIIRHELIHFRQQLELLVIPFYVFYLLSYLINLVVYRSHHLAYLNICFEREAYTNDSNPDYLKNRRFYEWVSYLKTRR